MTHRSAIGFGVLLTCCSIGTWAQPSSTQRIQQLDNSQVKVWKTIIYPAKHQSLSMHRHDSNRVVVALTDGKLKVKNDKGEVHYLHLKQGQAYFLTKDLPHELHSDQNVSGHPIEVVVVELKDRQGKPK